MPVELIVVPYVLGREGVGMGAGPLALAAAAAEALEAERVRRVALSAPFSNEIGACFVWLDCHAVSTRRRRPGRASSTGAHSR